MKETAFTKPEDIVAHYGEDYDMYFGAMSPPIFQTSLFVQNGQPYTYSRAENPSTDLAEEKIAALEHGDRALLVSSGCAAITTAIGSVIKAGDHVVMQRNAYGPAKMYMQYMERFGVSHTFVDGRTIENIEAAITEHTSVIYLESPSTFTFELQNLRQVAELAKSKGIVTIIDNTYSTPLFQKPLDFGIDMVVHSCTKYIGGHSDIVAGVIVGKKERMDNLCNVERGMYGNITTPMQGWLITRSLRTLPIRMERHFANAKTVAAFLESHPKVTRVFYPALKSNPQYDLYQAQMTGASGLMSFKVEGTEEQKLELLKKMKVFQYAVSWGGYDSLINAPGIRWKFGEADAEIFGSDGLYRISVGLEDVNTLLEDLENGLSALK